MAQQKGQNNISIYLKDRTTFTQLLEELRIIWFQTYGENLITSELLLKALAISKSYVQGNLKPVTITSDRFARLG